MRKQYQDQRKSQLKHFDSKIQFIAPQESLHLITLLAGTGLGMDWMAGWSLNNWLCARAIDRSIWLHS